MTSRSAGVERIGRGLQWLAVFCAAWVWRRLLVRTTFVGITGSVGKTTTKELLAAALSAHAPTAHSPRNENDAWGLPRSILRVRPWHRFAVLEAGAGEPGELGRSARLLRPQLAAVISVAAEHTDRFPTLEDMAREKATLLDALRASGTAVLNADDPHVAGMGSGASFEVRRFGTGADCEVRGEAAEARWPDRLRLVVHDGGDRHELQTRLVGMHWVNAVLAAWTLARACGMEASAIREALSACDPATGRLQPVVLPSGATLLRDEGGAAIPSLECALAVLREARAERRWLVTSDVAGCRVGTRKRLRRLARGAATLAEGVVFVGPHAHHGASGAIAAGMSPDQVRSFEGYADAARFLSETLGPGDLVLLKGRATDHLSRIYFAQLGEVACTLATCPKRSLCDECPQLHADSHSGDGRAS